MTYPVPEIWNIYGSLNKDGIVFSNGKVYADNITSDEPEQIAESGISADGSFTLTFSRWAFQRGNDSVEFPTIRIRVEDYQGNSLWTSNDYKEPRSELNIGPIDISKSPDKNGNCRVFGTVKNEQGNVLAGRRIDIYCLHFVEPTKGENESAGYFNKTSLGRTFSGPDGKYELYYNSSLLPKGLLLDSKEDYGKDKVSLYAEAYEEKQGIFYHKATEDLVFNGKSDQEIIFFLKSQQESFECEYQRLDSVLKVYYDAVIAWCSNAATNEKKINAINTFLKSNTVFPLVTGRERITDDKVRAYFAARSLYLQLESRLQKDTESTINVSADAESEPIWCETFFAIALREGITTLNRLAKAKPTRLQKTLFGAVSDGLICSLDTSIILKLWKKLVNGGTLDDEGNDKDDALTISQLISLYVKKTLTIEKPQETSSTGEEPGQNSASENSDENNEIEDGNGDEDDENVKAMPHYVAVENFENAPSSKKLFKDLLDAYYSAGADVEAFIELLQENALPEETKQTEVHAEPLEESDVGEGSDSSDESIKPQEIEVVRLTQKEISRLKTVFDLNDFFEKFAPGVVCTYREISKKEDFDFERLSDLIRLDDAEWSGIVDRIAEEYFELYRFGEKFTPTESEDESSIPYALPAEFPGNNRRLKKIIYARKLSELIISWFPQQALLWNLKIHFEKNKLTDDSDQSKEPGWDDVCDKLMQPEWENFSLSDTDLNEFVKGMQLNAALDEEEEKKVLQLQRLFHLTEKAEAIAYLVNKGFDSAYKVASIGEDEFVARHGNGIGKVEEARQIHRSAQNYMAEAALNIQAYVTSSSEEVVAASEGNPGEEPSEDSEDLSTLEELQEPQNMTLRALPRALPRLNQLKQVTSITSTNAAKVREATRDTVNWAGLFGNINFTKATQGQSILSASAYYLDLLKFLKKSSAYSIFIGRRPDYLELQLTKANAEISTPTIDLGIELLESLVAGPTSPSGKAIVSVNNNPAEATAETLRVEPIEFRDENNCSIDEAATTLMRSKIFPFQLPVNFTRDKARKILSNLSLHFYDIAELFDAKTEDTYNRRELHLDYAQRCLVDLLSDSLDKQDSLTKFNNMYNTWDLWGLKEKANEVLLLDKNSSAVGNYVGVLRRVAVILQKTGFTIQDLKEILSNENFNEVRYKPEDSEFYQLSNINGYVFVESGAKMDASAWDSFFRKMAVLVHRKNILGWSLSDVLLTFNLPLEKLDVICELIGRYGVTVQEALVLGGEPEVNTGEFLNSVYQLPSLLNCEGDEATLRRAALKLLNLGLGLSEEDTLLLYGMIDKKSNLQFSDILLECYRYNLIARTLKMSLSTLDKVIRHGVWKKTDRSSLGGFRKLSDEWNILSETSIDVDFYLDLLSPITEAEKAAADKFANNLNEAELGAPDADQELMGNNLKLLIAAEFGIAEDDFDALIHIESTWWPFYEAVKEFLKKAESTNGSSGESTSESPDESTSASSNEPISESSDESSDEPSDDSTEVSKETETKSGCPKKLVPVYVEFARKIALFNFIQTTQQGIDLNDNLFVKNHHETKTRPPLKNMRDLAYANYATDRLLSGEFNLGKLISYAESSSFEELGDILAIDKSVVQSLLSFAFGAENKQYTDTRCWVKFAKAYELYSKTYLDVTDFKGLLAEDSDDYSEKVNNLKDAVKDHMKDSEWRKFAQEMNDDLRRRKRDALAAYVCWDSCFVPEGERKVDGRYPRQFVDENDIYSYYLMDVKMEPDMAISRIVQASASIQLFVQRAELGLEGQNVLNSEQRSEWKWMKNYRVWEAARKVFLYPENWIASDLRDDKTPFFEELEDRIQEFSDDHGNLEKALFEYLEKIREVSSIEIMGAAKEDGGDEGGILYTLHIVGRTRGEPHAYYYRKYKAKAILPGEWTPWERLDVEIPSETVVPAIVNQRLYLLWPQVTLGQRNLDAAGDGGLETIEYYARIQVCWTSYTGVKWTGTRMSCNVMIDASTNPLDFTLGDNEKIDDRYNLKAISMSDGVSVSIIKTSYHYQEYEEVVGTTEVMDGTTKENKVTKRVYDNSRQFFKRIAAFKVNADGSDELKIYTSDEQPIEDFAPERTKLVHGVFVEDEEFTCGNKGFSYPEDNAVLNYTPGLFRIVATNLSMLKLAEDDKAEDLPFFYMDSRRTFFVQAVPKDGKTNSGQKNYKFELLSHSLVDDFYKRYRDGGTKWLYTRETQALPISDSYYYSYSNYNYYFSVYLGYYMAGDWQAWDLGQTIFRYNYWPNKANVDGPYPAPMVDFVWGGANSMYNWELFFYVPMLIAEKMIAEQSYEEALLWLQLVFDPRGDYTSYERTKHFIHDLPKGARYWKFLPFFANKDADKSVLQMLGMPTKRDRLPDRTALSSLVDKWKNDPFNPHLIARYRNVAYQKYVIMKYLDTLIGWGDLEFVKDTTESINLAIQFYLLAAELLGPKNAEAPEPESHAVSTAGALLTNTDSLGNAFIKYENSALVGKDRGKVLNIRAMDERARSTNSIVESMFYFRIPRNDVLFSYWDKVADRLYKIRNSLNIQGVKRTLSLFAPPIDPGLMVKARAMGLSVDQILSSTSGRLSVYRFRVIVKLAVDMAKDASQMGRDLLAILEKQDAEQLQVFKAKCDKAVIAESRAVHEMEVKSLEAEKVQLEEKKTTKQNTSAQKKAMHLVSSAEKKYQKIMEKVADIQDTIEKVRNIASATFKMPDFKYGSVVNAFGGPRFDIESLGGTKLAENLVSAAESYAARFAQRQIDAAKTKLQAELDRRKQEWTMEDDVADAEVVEVEKQEVVNEIKTQQVEKKQKSIENEILRSEQVYDVLSEKFTNNDLYIWLEKELGKVFQSYVTLLIDVAKMAERAYHFEIDGTTEIVNEFIRSDYWESLRKGLLSPEKILLDLRRMEKAYLENDKHKIEITRPILLFENLNNPVYKYSADDNVHEASDFPDGKYITVGKEKNAFEYQITISPELFNADFSMHNIRRIRDVRLQVITNGIINNYKNISAELSLTSKKVFAGIFATSMALSESGMFNFQFLDDKNSAFEGVSLDEASQWTLRLTGLTNIPESNNAKVVLYVSYSAIRSNNEKSA